MDTGSVRVFAALKDAIHRGRGRSVSRDHIAAGKGDGIAVVDRRRVSDSNQFRLKLIVGRIAGQKPDMLESHIAGRVRHQASSECRAYPWAGTAWDLALQVSRGLREAGSGITFRPGTDTV